MEWAGAFGDLGTLIPFVVAYITLLGMDPFGVLFAFGVALIATGLYYRTPFPVQPMKAIGAIATTQAAQTIVLTANSVYAAGLVTGGIWFVLGATGAIRWVVRLISRPVTQGIILGLGFAFMLHGIKLIAAEWVLGGLALVATFVLLGSRRIPVMFLLLAAGAGIALIRQPTMLDELAQMEIALQLPSWSLATLNWNDLVVGTLFLALPQLPLTLGNACIAVTQENNRLFPNRPVSEREVALTQGILNLTAPLVGGVPMCHGAGGLAGHVRFGARTGGAPIILGAVLILLAMFVSGSIATIFKLFPEPILGVILFFAGLELAVASLRARAERGGLYVTLVTAALTTWNVGLAFVVGMLLDFLMRRGLARP